MRARDIVNGDDYAIRDGRYHTRRATVVRAGVTLKGGWRPASHAYVLRGEEVVKVPLAHVLRPWSEQEKSRP